MQNTIWDHLKISRLKLMRSLHFMPAAERFYIRYQFRQFQFQVSLFIDIQLIYFFLLQINYSIKPIFS